MLRRIRKLLHSKAVVLMYHRIAEPVTDPWLLAVSAGNFEQQLQVLRRLYKVISVQELTDQLARRSVVPGSVCLTFDDGYSDNYLFAKPLLEKYQCPATFFLPTCFINQRELFWWDELENILLRTDGLPAALTLHLNGQPFSGGLGDESRLTDKLLQLHKKWIWYDPPPTQRCRLYYTLWEQIRALPHAQAAAIIRQLRQWAGTACPAEEISFPITTQQMHDIQRQQLFSIGLHTVTHPDLVSHSEQIQQQEITESIRFFQHFDRPVRTMAYPYGRYNDTTLSIVKDLQLPAVFTTQQEPVTKYSDPHRLGRFHVRNWNGGDFEKQLRRWSKTWFAG